MRLVGNVYVVLLVLAVVAGVRWGGDGGTADLAARLGAGPPPLDALLGWLPVGGMLAFLGLLALRTVQPLHPVERTAYGVLAVPWLALTATFLWTPLAGHHAGWLDDLGAGGDTFRAAVVAGHWALLATVALGAVLAVAQVASPHWQPGNEENERRSHHASALLTAGPAALALLAGWLVG